MKTERHHASRLVAFLIIAGPLLAACKSKPAPPPSNELVIVHAAWGALYNGATSDVTRLLAGKVKDNALTVTASVQELGDPARTKIKHLRVDYTQGGVPVHRLLNEGETLTIRSGERPSPPRLIVTSAVYGYLPSGPKIDVTAQVSDMVKDNTLSVTPTNVLFGDPIANKPKTLQVTYTFDGIAKTRSALEERPLLIGPTIP
jgi:hypothetical protein